MASLSNFFSSGGSKSRSTSTSYLPKQRKTLEKAIDLYTPQLGVNANVYQGQRVADFGGLQKGVFDFATNGGFRTTPEQTQQYFTDVIKNPYTKQYKETVNPAIKEAFSGPGYWGSARATAEAKGAQDLADTLNTEWGALNWDVMEANKQGALTEFELGNAQQVQSQNEINAAMQKFAEENEITDPRNLEILMQLLGLNYSKSTSSSDSRGEGIGYPAAQAGMGAVMGGLIASDERVKENIKKFDPVETVRQLNVCEYNYKGNPQKRIGFIAQEVEQVFPQAVIDVDGIKHVDLYAIQALTILAIQRLCKE